MYDKKAHWNKIYQDKSPLEVSWYQENPSLSLELIRNSGIARGDPIIDIGGGASLLVDCLRDEGYTNIAVLDVSYKALACAKQRLGKGARDIEWYERDITEFVAPHPFKLWHDRAVFHFLTDESERKKYTHSMDHALAPGGHVVIAAFAIGGPEQCSGLDIVQYDAEKLTAELGDKYQLQETRDETHRTPAGKEQKFSYFRYTRVR